MIDEMSNKTNRKTGSIIEVLAMIGGLARFM